METIDNRNTNILLTAGHEKCYSTSREIPFQLGLEKFQHGSLAKKLNSAIFPISREAVFPLGQGFAAIELKYNFKIRHEDGQTGFSKILAKICRGSNGKRDRKS